MGGGSARLRAHRRVTPLQALRERFADVVHERGCDIDVDVPLLAPESLLDDGFSVQVAGDPRAVRREDGLLLFTDDDGHLSFSANGTFVAREAGVHTFTLAQAGRARVYAGEDLLLDGTVDPPPPGTRLIGLVSADVSADLELAEGEEVPLR